jgi:hypothetical protein
MNSSAITSKITSKLAAALFVAGMSLGLPSSSFAVVGTEPSCGPENSLCTWEITADGVQVAQGTFGVGESGAISYHGDVIPVQGGGTVQIGSLSGNIDPILGFNASAGTAAQGKSFAFAFSIPIALEGPINASSSVSYSLTSLSLDGAQIAPTVADHVVIAQELDTSVGGADPLNKGVDVGDKFFFPGGPKTDNSPVFTKTNTFVGGLQYDLMSVTIAFSLSANSQVGISGFVSQNPVPEPSTYGMLAAGLLLVAWVARRRLS